MVLGSVAACLDMTIPMKNSTTCTRKAYNFCLFAAPLAIALITSVMALPAYAATNGGPTTTMALLKTTSLSPAIDAGDNGACPDFDQRGEARPKGPGCDIGAVEVDYTPVVADFFITSWKTDNPGQTGPQSFILPMVGGPYGIDFDGDGVINEEDNGLSGAIQLDFDSAGIVTIGIYGDFDAFLPANFGDGLKLVAVNQWGSHQWQSMNSAFQGASNMQVPASDTPDFSAVTDMSSMFENASLANPDTTGWDTGNVTTMKLMFSNALAADPDTSNWNVTSLQDASSMFSGVTLSTPNYDNLLVNWNAQALEVAVSLDAGNSVYCSAAAVAARDNLQYSHF